jgi:hypothetical protein
MLTPMGAPSIDDDLRTLGQLLWRHREQFEAMEYQLEVQHLLVANGGDRWLARSANDLQQAVDDLASSDGQRTVVLDRLAQTLGRPSPMTLAELARWAPAPWSDIFADQHAWFTEAVERVTVASHRARGTVEAGLRAVQDLLSILGGDSRTGYDPLGRSVPGTSSGSLLFDGRT